MDSPIKGLWQLANHRNPITVIVCSLILLTTIFLISMPFCPWSQRQIMEKFHLKSGSFLQWAAWQFVPSMYNFANETWVRPRPFGDQPDDGSLDTIHYRINHYPLRYASFTSDMRAQYKNSKRPVYFYIRSSYRGQALVSVYQLQRTDDESLELKKVR